jgi:hypothetical protein
MKKIKSFLFVTLVSLLLLPMESLFADSPILLKKDPGVGTLMLTRTVSTTVVTVTATLNNPDLVIDFSKPVGIAQIVILDATGSVVFQESIDTYSTLETLVDTSVFNSGNYTLKISYGTTNLKGSFRL